jgi:hypothetical protein
MTLIYIFSGDYMDNSSIKTNYKKEKAPHIRTTKQCVISII